MVAKVYLLSASHERPSPLARACGAQNARWDIERCGGQLRWSASCRARVWTDLDGMFAVHFLVAPLTGTRP